MIIIMFHAVAGVEFSEIKEWVSQDFWNSLPMYSLPRGNHIKLKFARMSWMRAVHISAQINFDIQSTHPKTCSLVLLSEGSTVSMYMKMRQANYKSWSYKKKTYKNSYN